MSSKMFYQFPLCDIKLLTIFLSFHFLFLQV